MRDRIDISEQAAVGAGMKNHLAARLGAGTRTDAYRAALSRYITADGTGADYEQIELAEHKGSMYCLALCEPAVHAQCAADPDIIALSPEVADAPALQAWLDGDLGNVAANIRTAIEADLIPIDDLIATNKRRELMRRIALYFRIAQYMRGNNDTNALAFLAQNLSTTRQQLPAAVRTRILAWCTERGISTAWTTNSTTVRALLKFILVNINLIPLRYVRAEL